MHAAVSVFPHCRLRMLEGKVRVSSWHRLTLVIKLPLCEKLELKHFWGQQPQAAMNEGELN